MFNPFFRSYVPGFRIGPDGVPGFNIDDYGLPQRASASSDGTFLDSAARQYPAAQPQTPPSISFSLPSAEGWVLSAPLIGSPGFSVNPQDEVPGFNVRPQDDDAPGFNVDENGVQRQQTTWSAGMPPESVTLQDLNAPQTPTSLPGSEGPTPSAPLQLSEWLYKLGTMLPPRLSTPIDPRIEINSWPNIGQAVVAGADQWPPSRAPQQPPDIDIRSRAATTQNTNPQPAAQQAMQTAWLQPPKDVWPVRPRGWCPTIDTVDQASRIFRRHPCWRCCRAEGAATAAVAAISAAATGNAVGSAWYWVGYSPPA